MAIRVAIHPRPGSFSDRWIRYCGEHALDHTPVDCLRSDIIAQLRGMNCLLWHWHQDDARAGVAARQVVMAAENAGLLVFPNTATCWHFDDKLAQKYLLEAVGAPLAPTFVFFEKDKALEWVRQASFPTVFKLRCGAGSSNVRLVRSRTQAERIVERAFGRGFTPVDEYFSDFGRKVRRIKDWGEFSTKLKRMPQSLLTKRKERSARNPEKGYVYFQEFIPDNQYDTRITVIGNRAFGFTRNVVRGDFRASGSGSLDYDLGRVDMECVKIAFETNARIGAQSLAFDFVKDPAGRFLIVEISYCYLPSAVHACTGHWDRDLRWHEGPVWPEDAIFEDLIAAVNARRDTRATAGLPSRAG